MTAKRRVKKLETGNYALRIHALWQRFGTSPEPLQTMLLTELPHEDRVAMLKIASQEADAAQEKMQARQYSAEFIGWVFNGVVSEADTRQGVRLWYAQKNMGGRQAGVTQPA